jgi:hypothetical protein
LLGETRERKEERSPQLAERRREAGLAEIRGNESLDGKRPAPGHT